MKRFVRFIISTNFVASRESMSGNVSFFDFVYDLGDLHWIHFINRPPKGARGRGQGEGLDSVHRLNGIKRLFDNDFTMLSQPWPRKFVARSFPIESRFNVRLVDGKMVGEQWAHCVIFCIMPSRSRTPPPCPPPRASLSPRTTINATLLSGTTFSPVRWKYFRDELQQRKKKNLSFCPPFFFFYLWDYKFSYLPGDK